MNTPNTQDRGAIGGSGQHVLVHRKDTEGALQVDQLTGQVIPGQEDLPEWAEGLISAQFAERTLWYTARLGDKFTPQMQRPDAYAFEDLSWITVSQEEANQGEEVELGYEAEHRMDVVAEALGLSRDEALEQGHFDGMTGYNETLGIELRHDDERTEEELRELAAAGAKVEDQQTGTGS